MPENASLKQYTHIVGRSVPPVDVLKLPLLFPMVFWLFEPKNVRGLTKIIDEIDILYLNYYCS